MRLVLEDLRKYITRCETLHCQSTNTIRPLSECLGLLLVIDLNVMTRPCRLLGPLIVQHHGMHLFEAFGEEIELGGLHLGYTHY